MEDARDKSVKTVMYVPMLRLNYIKGLDARGMAEILDGCTDYCEKYKAGTVSCTETSCIGCIEKWLNEEIDVPVTLAGGEIYLRETKEEKTCEK